MRSGGGLSTLLALSVSLSVLLAAGVAPGVQADLTTPYFNMSVDTGTWNVEDVGVAFSKYFGTLVTVQDVNGNNDITSANGVDAHVFEFFDANGASSDIVNAECKSLANSLSSDYEKTLGSIKSRLPVMLPAALSVIVRTTTFQLTFSAMSTGTAAQQHSAMDKGIEAVMNKFFSPFTNTVETLMEGATTEVKTFQFYGDDGVANAQLWADVFPLSTEATGDWSTEFVNNGGLTLTSAILVKQTVETTMPPAETGFAAWVSSNPEILAGIGGGVVVIVFAIIVVVVHRRAKRQEMLQDTMEAMLGQDQGGEKGGNIAASQSAAKSTQPAGAAQAAPAPSGGQPAATPTTQAE